MTAAEPAVGRSPDDRAVRAFVERLQRAHRQAALAQVLGAPALAMACVVAAVLLWSPKAALWVAGGCALLLSTRVAIALALAALGRRAALRRYGLVSGRLGDELLTFDELDRSGRLQAPMAAWLCGDTAQAVRALDAAAQRRPLRPTRLGRSRYLLPLLVLLLLIWALRPDLSLPVPGLGGGAGGRGAGNGGGAGAGGGAVAGNNDSNAQAAAPSSPPQPESPPPPEPDPSPPASPPVAAEPPPPLLDLPVLPHALVPEFTADGPVRRALAPRALVDAPNDDPAGGGAAPAPKMPAPAPGNGGGDAAASEPTQEQLFERAAERALQSRRVPPEERAIVRRFFELLREAK